MVTTDGAFAQFDGLKLDLLGSAGPPPEELKRSRPRGLDASYLDSRR
jgi:hypothetical protein